LKYRINIRVLGVIRTNGNALTFVPSHRRLPHVGSKVAFPSPEVLREIAGHNIDGASIGHLALGEYIYYGNSPNRDARDWMQIVQPEVQVRFPTASLVSRRSFVFARAGLANPISINFCFLSYTTRPLLFQSGAANKYPLAQS